MSRMSGFCLRELLLQEGKLCLLLTGINTVKNRMAHNLALLHLGVLSVLL